MKVRRDGKSERSDGYGHRGVRRRYKRPITQAKALVNYMNRKCDSGGQKGQQSPGDTRLTGGGPTGKRPKCDADDKVHDTKDYHYSEPLLTTRCIHVCDPTGCASPGRRIEDP